MAINPGDAGVLTQITESYLRVFSGYINQFVQYGKEIFAVLFVINLTWIALWYAFDKDFVSGMSDFLKKFVVAMIFYIIMVSPQYLGSIIDTSTQMGLNVTGAASVDPSSIINIGTNMGAQVLKSIHDMSLMLNPIEVLVKIGVFFVVVFCFMSVALHVAVTQVIATALAVLSCFTLGFSGLGVTTGIARRSIDAVICASFKLLGYYMVIGASIPVFSDWEKIQSTFFQGTKQSVWLCASTLMFWLLSKSLASVFERVGGGLVGETSGVDVTALAISMARAPGMDSVKKPTLVEIPRAPLGGGGGDPGFNSPTSGGTMSKMTTATPEAKRNGERSMTQSVNSSSHKGAHATSTVNSSKQDNVPETKSAPSGRKNAVHLGEKKEEESEQDRRTYPSKIIDGVKYKTDGESCWIEWV